MLTIFFNIKGIVHKEYVLANKTANSANCCNVFRRLRENVLRLCLEIWQQTYWLLHHNAPSHTSFFTREFFTKTTWLSSPTQPTRLTFRMNLKHIRHAENGVYARKETTSTVVVEASRPKVTF
jgi:hypothetical protein